MTLLKTIRSFEKDLNINNKNIREYDPPKNKSDSNNILLTICGLFSVAFSMSTLTQLYTPDSTPLYMILGLSIFLLLIFIFNERYKVKSLISVSESYSRDKKLPIISLSIAIVTVCISLTSVFGLYTSIDKIIDLNALTGSATPELTHINKQIDSLNNLLLYRVDSIAKATNPNTQDNIKMLSLEISKLNKHQIANKEVLLLKLEEENKNLVSQKNELKSYFLKEIKDLNENKTKLEALNNKNNDNSTIIKIALAFLAFITEVVIIGTALNKGTMLYSYVQAKENYDKSFADEVERRRKELMNKPHTKKLLEYINVLEMLYDLKSEEITRKHIENVTEFRGRRYTQKEVNDFRTTLLELEILIQQPNTNKTKLSISLEDSINSLDKFFSKIK